MLYLKIMQGDTVVTAEAHENPAYVKYQQKNNIKVRCSEHEAQGIISLDGAEVYQLPGKESLNVEKTAVEIAMTQYEEIIAEADENLDDDVPAENPEGDEHVMTATEIRAAISSLTETVEALQEQNEFLEECLLEMSESVYA